MSQQLSFNQLKEKVFMYWPTAKYLPQAKDTLSVFDFSKSFIKINSSSVAQQRQSEFRQILHDEVKKLLGSKVAQSVENQLRINHSFSTAQHFSSVSHTRTLNSALQIALPYFEDTTEATNNVLILSCANISFDNPWFPRGILMHSVHNNELVENQLAFFSRKVRPLPIRNHPGYTQETIAEIMAKVMALKNDGVLSHDVSEKVLSLLQNVFSSADVLDKTTFSEQVTITNFHIWKDLLAKTTEGLSIPNLIFMEQENIVLKLLTKHHLFEKTIIHELLFNPDLFEAVEKHFDNIQGGFSLKNGTGTYLFWAMPPGEKYRFQLFREGNTLINHELNYRVELTPESIAEKIESNELIPSSLLSLTLLAMYYGYILTGGMDQPTYLTQIKNAYLSLARILSDDKSITVCQDLKTDNITITRPTLAYVEGPSDSRDPATGLDPILYGEKGTFNRILEASKKVTIDNLIDRVLPNVYAEYVPDAKKTTDESEITERQIEKLTGLDKKIPALARL